MRAFLQSYEVQIKPDYLFRNIQNNRGIDVSRKARVWLEGNPLLMGNYRRAIMQFEDGQEILVRDFELEAVN